MKILYSTADKRTSRRTL